MNNISISTKFENAYFEDAVRDLAIFKELTILVVDDDQDLLLSIAEVFEIYGINVMTADNALEAFKIIEQSKLDLLISDINMPREDGYWLIQKVRTLTPSEKREIPAIAFTGNAEVQTNNKALASGFQTCIQKPAMKQLITETAKVLKDFSKSTVP